MIDPRFSYNNKQTRRVAALVIKFEDGEEQILEFEDDNNAFYRVRGNARVGEGNRVESQFNRHELWWIENHEGA